MSDEQVSAVVAAVLACVPPSPPPRARVVLGWAASADGSLASAPGARTGLSCAASFAATHALRAAAACVLVGYRTVLSDDPRLSARGRAAAAPAPGGPQPAPAVLDAALRTPPSARALAREGGRAAALVLAARRADVPKAERAAWDARRAALVAAGARVVHVRAERSGGNEGRADADEEEEEEQEGDEEEDGSTLADGADAGAAGGAGGGADGGAAVGRAGDDAAGGVAWPRLDLTAAVRALATALAPPAGGGEGRGSGGPLIFIEGGARLLSALLARPPRGVPVAVALTLAPRLLPAGPKLAAAAVEGGAAPAPPPRLREPKWHAVGDDVWLVGGLDDRPEGAA